MGGYIGAVDQGTTSSRFIIFDASGRIVAMDQKEHRQIFPEPGHVEHDPMEIWENTREVIAGALRKAGITGADLAALGITNQRETVVVWDRRTGRPSSNAIVWQCARTRDICEELIKDGGPDRFRAKTGLPVATYFSGPKIKWILDNVPEARRAAEAGEALFGTMESWIIWWLTGGPRGGAHVTDVTNASRTMLMDLATLEWDDDILDVLDIPRQGCRAIVPSSDAASWGPTMEDGPSGPGSRCAGPWGTSRRRWWARPASNPARPKTLTARAASCSQHRPTPIPSRHGLITTLAYSSGTAIRSTAWRLGGHGRALVQWVRDNLGLIQSAPEIERLAMHAEDNGGVYIVPAFSGLFAPYWRSDARGAIVGLTRYANRYHLARAVLEACAYQTRDIVEAMNKDSGVALTKLKVDGGMVGNELLMQFQADVLDVPVIRPMVSETTCLGAAYAAGLAVGFWRDTRELCKNWSVDRVFEPGMDAAARESGYRGWKKAVERTLNWVD